MSFISYAQNYEDVILWRALHDVERGFYVDVGAADPEEWSVTRAFYERGWWGINVEPLEQYFHKLKQARPRDTNLKVAVGREAGVRTLHTIAETGLSTFDPKIAARHRAAGWDTNETGVPTLTLAKILEDCAPSTIHFLKIDVEGAELEVLEGMNLDRVRPWIILIEATEPFSTVSTRDNWEHLVTGQGYQFAYFDGLNCFYVADEVSRLKERLAVPPNVFDEFVRRQEILARERVSALERELAGERTHAFDLCKALQVQKDRGAELRKALQVEKEHGAELEKALQTDKDHMQHLIEHIRHLEAELATPTHKILLRRLRDAGDRVTGGGLRALANRTLKASLQRAAGHRQLAAVDESVPKPFPAPTKSLQGLATAKEMAVAMAGPLAPGSAIIPDQLPASARRIYAKLRNSVSESYDLRRVQ